MDESANKELLKELNDFHKWLKAYKRRIISGKQQTEAQERYTESLREKLIKKSGAFAQTIETLTKKRFIKLPMIGEVTTIWAEGLSNFPSPYRTDALDKCIDATREAIGKLEARGNTETSRIKWTKNDVIKKVHEALTEKDNVQRTGNLELIFDSLQLHEKVVESSKSCFITGNYREAILNAFINLIDYVKEITGLDIDGDDLMNHVFSFNYDKERRRVTKHPILCISGMKNRTDRDEQQGFMYLCKGAAIGIRNPKAHALIPQSNPFHTLEYLAFASLLMRRVEKAELLNP